jgi:glyceraldehyde-3-phosphate dehydrogenase/erythrose-4-phosphate dehydrogenase
MAGKVAINGLGRIGRAALKLVLEPQLQLVAVNEIGSLGQHGLSAQVRHGVRALRAAG